MGGFILGLDGETPGAGKRICSFIEQTDIPINVLGLLQAPTHTRLWQRLEREGRLRRDIGHDGGTFAPLNYDPDRPEAEIMQEYIDAWDYLYEPSRYLARTYRYYLAMRPTRLAMAIAKGAPRPPDSLPAYKKTWRTSFYEIRALLTTPVAARDTSVVPASVLDPVDRHVETKPEPIRRLSDGLHHGRGPLLPEKNRAGKNHRDHEAAGPRGYRGNSAPGGVFGNLIAGPLYDGKSGR